jgi:hypothetical protein
METPIPALIPRGILSFLWRKETMGSAAAARRAPKRKGKNRGKKKRITSQNRKKRKIMEDNLGLPERKGETPFQEKNIGVAF